MSSDHNIPDQESPSSVKSLPAADIQANMTGESASVTSTYPIRQPERDLNDFQVMVRASTLTKCRHKLTKITKIRFELPELLLAIAALSAGAILSAIIAGIALASPKGIAFFIVGPMLLAGSTVAYFLLRQLQRQTAKILATEVLEDLPEKWSGKTGQGLRCNPAG